LIEGLDCLASKIKIFEGGTHAYKSVKKIGKKAKRTVHIVEDLNGQMLTWKVLKFIHHGVDAHDLEVVNQQIAKLKSAKSSYLATYYEHFRFHDSLCIVTEYYMVQAYSSLTLLLKVNI
jgi:hypothetical protein